MMQPRCWHQLVFVPAAMVVSGTSQAVATAGLRFGYALPGTISGGPRTLTASFDGSSDPTYASRTRTASAITVR